VRKIMINNLEDSAVKQKIASETSNPVIKAICDIVSKAGGVYGIISESSGLEFISTTEIKGFPNRSRMKLFSPEKQKVMAWFYKPSAVHFSRDRYSLGGILLEEAGFDPATIVKDVENWLAWLDSGLDPEKRPENWKSAVPYDIPN
jgi:hypothetical protein